MSNFTSDTIESATKQELVCKALGLTNLPQTKEELDEALSKLEDLALNELKNIAPPLPKPPQMTSGTVSARLLRLQQFIEEFQYNHTGKRFIQLKKTEGMYRVSRTAKQIIQDGMPIKCIEAVFLGAYLTLEMNTLTRIPVAFKSRVGKNTFQHIIMAVSNGSSNKKKWGAIGLSRAKSLMYKQLKYTSLSNLLLDFKKSYEKEHHELINIYVGLPFGRDEFNQIPIQWRVLKIKVNDLPWETIENVLNIFTTNANKYLTSYTTTQQLPEEMSELFHGHMEPAATKILVQSPKRNKINHYNNGSSVKSLLKSSTSTTDAAIIATTTTTATTSKKKVKKKKTTNKKGKSNKNKKGILEERKDHREEEEGKEDKDDVEMKVCDDDDDEEEEDCEQAIQFAGEETDISEEKKEISDKALLSFLSV
jgi:hypothetical protein